MPPMRGKSPVDARWLDGLARGLATKAPRRRVLRGLGALGLASLGAPGPTPAGSAQIEADQSTRRCRDRCRRRCEDRANPDRCRDRCVERRCRDAQRLAVPSYFRPGPLWTQLEAGVPAVGLAIINPNSGPGAAPDQSYAAQVARSQAAGLTVLGYVFTDYGARPATEVKADVDSYYRWYGVDGIFFDEAFSRDCTKQAYYREIRDHVKAKAGKRVVAINPGTRTQECYLSTADIIVNFEGTYASYASAWELEPTDWERRYPANRFWHLVHATDRAEMPNAVGLAKQRNAGWVYVTPDALPNPWDTLPPGAYWRALLAAL